MMQPHYDKWQAYIASRPNEAMAPCHTTQLWFIILVLVTFNIWLSFLATLVICVVICGVLAIIFLLGGALGMFECLVMILSIGLAVDYDVHITHFYSVASGTRQEKVTEALCGVGVSIIGGALTTMGAGLPLFFCAMTFFKLCGWFIFYTSLVSLVMSFG